MYHLVNNLCHCSIPTSFVSPFEGPFNRRFKYFDIFASQRPIIFVPSNLNVITHLGLSCINSRSLNKLTCVGQHALKGFVLFRFDTHKTENYFVRFVIIFNEFNTSWNWYFLSTYILLILYCQKINKNNKKIYVSKRI